jgi:hypothetical protein
VILPFTNQDDFAARKATALAAINGLTASDGGDTDETPFDGLRLALNGSIGEWRYGAGTRQIFLFTDSPAKDYNLAGEVTALAHNIGATISDTSALALAGGKVNTFNLTFNSSNLEELTDPVAPATTLGSTPSTNPTAQVQIFTVYSGGWNLYSDELAAIANNNGGAVLTAPTNDELVQQILAIINVNDDLPVILIAVTDTDADEPNNPGQFTLTRTGITTQTLAVNYMITGTATNGIDNEKLTGTATFQAGSSTATIDVKPIDDNIDEGNETIILTLTDGGTNYKLDPVKSSGTVTIADNETRPIISINDVLQAEGNTGTNNFAFNLTLSKPSTETVTVKYTTADGTATAASDYTAATGTVTFNPGETSKTVNISVKGDTTLELDETFTVNLTDAVGGTISRATGTGTIIDDDRPVIALTTPDANASEDKKDPGLFNITRTGTTTQALTVTYTIAGTATNDTDYKNITGTATFKAGAAQTSIEIKPSDDKIYEGNETILLTLNDGGTNYKIDPVAKTGTVIIADDDLPSISLNVTNDNPRNLVVKVENFDEINPRIGTGLQTGAEGEVIDLRGFDGRTLKVDTIGGGDSVYKSYIGFYFVEDTQGTLANGLKVSDAGYAEAAIKSAVLRSFKTESTKDFNLTGGKILAPVVIANGTFEDYLKRNPQNQASSDIHAYFDYIGANTDKVDHFRLLGDNKFGIEDTYGGGDKDYNDIIFQMNIKG